MKDQRTEQAVTADAPQHTSGPWKLSGAGVYSPKPELSICQTYTGVVAGINGSRSIGYDEAAANARLIAAAPDLLEAVELLVKRCGPKAEDGKIGLAAIAKARGEARPSLSREQA